MASHVHSQAAREVEEMRAYIAMQDFPSAVLQGTTGGEPALKKKNQMTAATTTAPTAQGQNLNMPALQS